MTLPDLIWTLLIDNLLTFGSGTLMLPLLQHALVEDTHLLTSDQLLYAYALSRVTPGQVNLYVASIGYMLFGLPGAAVAIVAIAIPAYVMIPLMRGLHHFRDNQMIRRFTRGLAATSVGLILSSTVDLGRSSLTGTVPWLVFLLALALLLFTKWPVLVSLATATVFGVGLLLLQQHGW